MADDLTRNYARVPAFLVENDTVRLRTEGDSPFRHDAAGPLRNQGTFRLGNRRAGKLVRISHEMLQAGGCVLGLEISSLLRLLVGFVRLYVHIPCPKSKRNRPM